MTTGIKLAKLLIACIAIALLCSCNTYREHIFTRIKENKNGLTLTLDIYASYEKPGESKYIEVRYPFLAKFTIYDKSYRNAESFTIEKFEIVSTENNSIQYSIESAIDSKIKESRRDDKIPAMFKTVGPLSKRDLYLADIIVRCSVSVYDSNGIKIEEFQISKPMKYRTKIFRRIAIWERMMSV